jgi:hypothetical protein
MASFSLITNLAAAGPDLEPAQRLAALARFGRGRYGLGAPKALSGDPVAALLKYADVREELELGRSLLSLSATRLRLASKDPAVRADQDRLAGMAVVWDERFQQVVEVIEGAARPKFETYEDELWAEACVA